MIGLEYLLFGFFVKIMTGFDDTITTIPLMSYLAKTKIGKWVFSLGMLLAVVVAIIVSLFFSEILEKIPYYKYITAGLIFVLAILIYFDIFIHKQSESKKKKSIEIKSISIRKISALFGVGFITSIVTVLDDIIAYLPLFLKSVNASIFAVIGILIGALLEIIIIIYFSKVIKKIRFKRQIASISLVVLGMLLLTGVL